jgi:hypothetical protein
MLEEEDERDYVIKERESSEEKRRGREYVLGTDLFKSVISNKFILIRFRKCKIYICVNI